MHPKLNDENKQYEKQYKSFFEKFFDNLINEFFKYTGYRDEEDISINDLPIYYFIKSLPCQIYVKRIKIDKEMNDDAKSEVYFIIKYDFTKLGKLEFRYFGETSINDLHKCSELKNEYYLDSEQIERIKKLNYSSCYGFDPWIWISILHYDLLKDYQCYTNDFLFNLRYNFRKVIFEKFDKTPDFNSEYNLKPDRMYTKNQLLKKCGPLNSFGKINKNGRIGKITFRDLQQNVSNIQLIPTVSKDVKKVFKAAKKLYMFGYFDYFFFTISQHYAYLALESALANKYEELFGETKDYLNFYNYIEEFVKRGIIPKREEPHYHAARRLRNSLSHLKEPATWLPDSETLSWVASKINQLYHKEFKIKNEHIIKS